MSNAAAHPIMPAPITRIFMKSLMKQNMSILQKREHLLYEFRPEVTG
jgi:hypothetical protein